MRSATLSFLAAVLSSTYLIANGQELNFREFCPPNEIHASSNVTDLTELTFGKTADGRVWLVEFYAGECWQHHYAAVGATLETPCKHWVFSAAQHAPAAAGETCASKPPLHKCAAALAPTAHLQLHWPTPPILPGALRALTAKPCLLLLSLLRAATALWACRLVQRVSCTAVPPRQQQQQLSGSIGSSTCSTTVAVEQSVHGSRAGSSDD
jgi:hypothetical protein